MKDKYVWVKWMELRVHSDVGVVRTPVGLIPKYDDLARLFGEVLGRDYSREEYEKAFTLRIPEYLAKVERMHKVFTEQVTDTPEILLDVLEEQEERLRDAQGRHGDYVSPFTLEAEPPEEE
jgi:phosphoenolpyruvate carboxykinase (GTP)